MINASLDTQPARDRMEGYRLALEEAGLPFRSERVFISGIGKQDGFNRDAGRVSMEELIRRNASGGGITAAFVASDVQALGAIETARDMGVRIPEDIAIVSFDDIELAQHAQLTTMRQPMHEMGMLALERLFHRMKDPTAVPTRTAFLPELIIRKSCGAESAADRATPSTGRIELVPSIRETV